MTNLETLIAMHTARPYQSVAQQDFIDKWILSLPGAVQDEKGNVWVVIGESKTVFSCHTDTVHRSTDPIIVKQVTSEKDGERLWAWTDDGKKGGKPIWQDSILGADDSAGCYVMREMVLAGVPGTFIFHTGEEVGGIGSSWIAEHHDMTGYDRCIAFDRRGSTNVITNMVVGRTCSDTFAEALSAALNGADPTFRYKPDATGSYTDSAEYVEQIPECTNVSVGYAYEHTESEELDFTHTLALAAACCLLDWESLPVERDPSVREPKAWASKQSSWLWRSTDSYEEWDETLDSTPDKRDLEMLGGDALDTIECLDTWNQIVDYVKEDPKGVAALLVEYFGLLPQPKKIKL